MSLKDDFLLEQEGDMAGLLGINIVRDKDNSLIMAQTRLIEWILASMEIENYNLEHTPGDKDPLCKDEDRDPGCEN